VEFTGPYVIGRPKRRILPRVQGRILIRVGTLIIEFSSVRPALITAITCALCAYIFQLRFH